MDDIVQNLISDKKKYLSDPKNNIFLRNLKSVLGKSFSEIESKEINNLNSYDFEKFITSSNFVNLLRCFLLFSSN